MHSRPARLVTTSFIGACLLGGSLAPSALAAAPDGAGSPWEVSTWDSEVDDQRESDTATELCGFVVDAVGAGQSITMSFPTGGQRRMLENTIYSIRVTYTNRSTGRSVTVREAGPSQRYLRGGETYLATVGTTFYFGFHGRQAGAAAYDEEGGYWDFISVPETTGRVLYPEGQDMYGWICAELAEP